MVNVYLYDIRVFSVRAKRMLLSLPAWVTHSLVYGMSSCQIMHHLSPVSPYTTSFTANLYSNSTANRSDGFWASAAAALDIQCAARCSAYREITSLIIIGLLTFFGHVVESWPSEKLMQITCPPSENRSLLLSPQGSEWRYSIYLPTRSCVNVRLPTSCCKLVGT